MSEGTEGTEGEVERWKDGDDRLGQEMAELVGRLSSDDMDRETRGRLLGRFARLMTARARRTGPPAPHGDAGSPTW